MEWLQQTQAIRENKFTLQSDNSHTLGIQERWDSHPRPLMAELGEWAPLRLICRGFGYGVLDKKVSAVGEEPL